MRQITPICVGLLLSISAGYLFGLQSDPRCTLVEASTDPVQEPGGEAAELEGVLAPRHPSGERTHRILRPPSVEEFPDERGYQTLEEAMTMLGVTD